MKKTHHISAHKKHVDEHWCKFEKLKLAEYNVACVNLASDYKEAVSYNLKRNKARVCGLINGLICGFMFYWFMIYIIDLCFSFIFCFSIFFIHFVSGTAAL